MTTIEPPVATGVDPDQLKLFSFLVFSKLEGTVTAGMIHLGDKLGLYRALASAAGPSTSAELAAGSGLDERWVREWLHNQAAARIVSTDDDGATFSLTPEGVAVLVDPGHPAFGMGLFGRLPETDGHAQGAARLLPNRGRLRLRRSRARGSRRRRARFEPWYRNFLVPVALPSLEGVVAKLERRSNRPGGRRRLRRRGRGLPPGQGVPGEHGPRVRHLPPRPGAGRGTAGRGGAGQRRLPRPGREPLPTDGSLDLVTTFDCIHDMTHPQEMMNAIRAAIAADGTWLLVDIKARETFAENVAKNPMAPMMYGMSVMSCMSSALSEPGGAGLGTLGLPESRARQMAEQAGFTRFRKLDIDHPINAFYEVRP